MSIVRFRNTMQSWFRPLMLVLAIVMAVGIVFMMAGLGGPGQTVSSKPGILAKVNSRKIMRQDFEKSFNDRLDQMNEVQRLSAFEESQLRGKMFDELVDQMIRLEAAKKERIRISRRDLNAKIAEIVKDEMGRIKAQYAVGRKKELTDEAFDTELKDRGSSLSKLKAEIRASIDTAKVREQLMADKLNEELENRVKADDETVKASYDEVVFSQITIGTQKRSEVQAEQRAKEIAAKLRGGGNFTSLAKEYSEDPYKAAGGARGYPMGRAYMEKPLAEAVFGLKVGDIGGPVKTTQGYVIVKLDKRQSKLPSDWNDPKKRKEYKDDYIAQEQYRIQAEYFDNLQKTAKVEIYDHELRGYRILRDMAGSLGPGSAGSLKSQAENAIKEFKQAVTEANGEPDPTARAYVDLAYLYNWMRKPGLFSPTKDEQAKYQAEAKAALTEALNYTESDDLRLMLAEINIEEGKKDQALEHIQIVSENASDDYATHTELMKLLEEVRGSKKVADMIAGERKWLDDYRKRMQEQGGAGGFNIPMPSQ